MYETELIITYFIKIVVINLLVYFCFKRISNISKQSIKNIVLVLILNVTITLVNEYISYYNDFLLSMIILTVAYSVGMGMITKMKLGYSLVVGIISYAICFVVFVLSLFFSFLLYKIIYNVIKIENGYLNLLMSILIQFIIMYGIGKIKRFKNGLAFLRDKLNNDFTDILVINISTIVIIIYCSMGAYNDQKTRSLFTAFVILGITMVITIQKTLTMYYKQKLMKETLTDYERDLAEKDEEIKRLKDEKFNISKITHEFYNRQKALEKAVKDNIQNGSMTTEAAEELGALDRIENLSNEYTQKLEAMKSLPALPLTGIPEIDDMFKYMQEECDKNNIEFKLKIAGDMFYLVNHIIPKNRLETLIGDHIRDAIIAINFNKTENANREIFVILGVKDKKYELCIYDTGIEFEIETLIKLGIEPATTHKDSGGSGIGFITTFETLKDTKASLIIKEEPVESRQYTKSLTIRFDDKCQYRICSYRADEIKKKNNGRKILIEKL